MKICLISNLYEPYNRGGAEQIVKDTINGLKNEGENVFLITTKPFKNLSSLKTETTEENGVKIYRFYPLNIFSYINIDKHNAVARLIWHLLDIFNNHSYFTIKKILKREKPDVVHTHNLKGIGFLTPKAIKKAKIKHIHTLHDIQLVSPSGLMIIGKEDNWQQTGIFTKIYSSICRLLFDSPQIIISPSNWLMDYYKEKGFFRKSQKFILRNPVNIIIKEITRSKEESDKEKINFLFIGQIEYHKGILFLIDVFNSLVDLNIKLDIIGDGTLLKEAKKTAGNNVNFLGRIPHEDVLKRLKETDFLVIPSLCYENSPTVLLEALSAENPAIVADAGGAAEFITPDNGYKFEAGSKEDLINKIKLATKNLSNFDHDKIKNTINKMGVGEYMKKLINLYNHGNI